METQNPIIIYKTYSEAQKKAVLKWRANNKGTVNGLAKKYYDQKKDNPEYIQKKRDASKRYYERRKEFLKLKNEFILNEIETEMV
jgi:hypothetical protein